MNANRFSLQGKVALVTGGKRGIGRAIALAFAEAGADIAVCSRIIEDKDLVTVAYDIEKHGQRCLAVQADISQKADVENLVRQVVGVFGDIDILVNNAGYFFKAPFLDTGEDDWDRMINTNLKGCYFCCQEVGKKMAKRKKGNIINIASTVTLKAFSETSAYSVAKAGVIMLTRVLAVELAAYNIRVNAISPSLIRTKLIEPWYNEEALKQKETRIPLRRLALPNDITGAAIFLASDDSSFVTGQTIVVDGGSEA